jgi:hypothetical protein
MRAVSYSYMVPVLSALVAGIGFMACSDDVNTSSSSGSASGSGGAGGEGAGTGGAAQSSSVASSSASSAASSTSGGGGASVCDQACDRLEGCFGLDVCPFLMVDCDTVGMGFDCPGECVLDATCEQLLTLTNLQSDPSKVDPELFACYNACNGGAGGAGGGGMGDCNTCAGSNCFGPIQACNGAQECQDWLQCVQGCQDGPCSDACDAMYAGAKPLFEPVYECVCNSCANDCSSFDPCKNQGAGGAGGGGMGGAGMGGSGMGGSGMGGSGMGGSGMGGSGMGGSGMGGSGMGGAGGN